MTEYIRITVYDPETEQLKETAIPANSDHEYIGACILKLLREDNREEDGRDE